MKKDRKHGMKVKLILEELEERIAAENKEKSNQTKRMTRLHIVQNVNGRKAFRQDVLMQVVN